MNPTFSCIVPYHNEAPRISSTLAVLSKSKYVQEIIAVDDGSTDNPQINVTSPTSTVKMIHLDSHKGKSEAVQEGFSHTKGSVIFLIDADLKDLKIEEIDAACQNMIDDPEVDMLILKSTQGTIITRLCRQDIVLSGARFLKRSDLENIFKAKPHGYQLEVAINTYMIENKKKYFFTKFSGYNTLRSEKIGLIPATIGLAKLLKDVYSYRGYFSYIRQLLTFCHRELR